MTIYNKECYKRAPWHPLDKMTVGIGGLYCKECRSEVDDHFMIAKLGKMVHLLLTESGYKECNHCGEYHKPGKELVSIMGEWCCVKCSPVVAFRTIGEDGDPATIPGAEEQWARWIIRYHREETAPEEILTVQSMIEPKRWKQLYNKIVR